MITIRELMQKGQDLKCRVAKLVWVEEKHPRVAAGSSGGGEFASGSGGGQ